MLGTEEAARAIGIPSPEAHRRRVLAAHPRVNHTSSVPGRRRRVLRTLHIGRVNATPFAGTSSLYLTATIFDGATPSSTQRIIAPRMLCSASNESGGFCDEPPPNEFAPGPL